MAGKFPAIFELKIFVSHWKPSELFNQPRLLCLFTVPWVGFFFREKNLIGEKGLILCVSSTSLNQVNIVAKLKYIYRISANSFRGNYSFLEVGVRQVFKGGNYQFFAKLITLWFLCHFKEYLVYKQFALFFS